MKIYSRYVLWNAIKWLTIMMTSAILGAFLLMSVKSMMEGLPISVVFLILPYMFTEGFTFLTPFAVFFAMWMTFSPMTAHGEITALKIVGVPMWRMLIPVYLIISIICIANVQVADYSMSTAREKMNQTLINSCVKIVTATLKKEKVYSDPKSKLTIEVDDVDEYGKLINPTVMFISKNANNATIKADHVQLGYNYKRKKREKDGKEEIEAFMTIDAQNTRVVSGTVGATLPDHFHEEIPINELLQKKQREDPRESEVKEKLQELAEERNEYHRQMASKYCFALLCGNVDESSKAQWQSRRWQENEFKRRYNLYRLVSPRNWSGGFASFFFAWTIIPFTIYGPKFELRFRKKKITLPALVVEFAIIVALYYGSYGCVYDACKRGNLHPCFMWTGDVLLAILGAYYLKKIH